MLLTDAGGTRDEIDTAVRRQYHILLEWRRNALREMAAAVACGGDAVH